MNCMKINRDLIIREEDYVCYCVFKNKREGVVDEWVKKRIALSLAIRKTLKR